MQNLGTIQACFRGMSLKKAGKTVCLCLSMTNPNDNDDYAIQTVLDVKTIASNGKMCTKTKEHVFKYWENEDVGIELMSCGKMSKNYVIDGKLTIEARVKILEMSGIKKRKLRNFDETTKGYSDITLVVGEQKFYVSKLYLASHSKYFDSLLLGKFQESKKSEVVLRDIQPEDFQNFLEVLHGEDAISGDFLHLQIAINYFSELQMRLSKEFSFSLICTTLRLLTVDANSS